jgi:ribulose-phosphate 3-epimerase
MQIICPAILASTPEEYRAQIEKVGHFAQRIQIDLTDGSFAPSNTVKAKDAWWPVGVKADFHLMMHHPFTAVRTILEHQPNMVIVHAESEGDFPALVEFCHERGVRVGVALLAKTAAETILPALGLIDHVLIFSGDLGHFGGQADLDLLGKVQIFKDNKPDLEIGWDGGINDQNISALAAGGVDVFNVGGFIQKADNPEKTFQALQRIVDETGTT